MREKVASCLRGPTHSGHADTCRMTAAMELCEEYRELYGCIESYQRFCEITVHETWRSKDEFLESWFTFAGDEKECVKIPPSYIAEKFLLAFCFIIIYFIFSLCEKVHNWMQHRHDHLVTSSCPELGRVSRVEEDDRRASV